MMAKPPNGFGAVASQPWLRGSADDSACCGSTRSASSVASNSWRGFRTLSTLAVAEIPPTHLGLVSDAREQKGQRLLAKDFVEHHKALASKHYIQANNES